MDTTRAVKSALGAIALLALLGGPGLAGGIVATDTAARDVFAGSMKDSLAAAALALKEATRRDLAKATGKALFYDPSTGSFSQEDGTNDTDLAWARANTAVIDMLRQFGADPGSRVLSFRREGNRYYVGAEGLGGAWFTVAARAQSHLFRMLLADAKDAPEEAVVAVNRNRTSQASLQHAVNIATKAVQSSKAFVALGGETKVKLTSKKFEATGEPQIVGPPGIVVYDVTRQGKDTLLATIRTDPAIGTGAQTLHGYDEGRSYRQADSFGIFVTGTPQPMTPLADAVGATPAEAATLTPGETVRGMVEARADQDLYRVDLAAGGRLTLASGGPTDILLKLEDENGKVQASDDDGGRWYQARLSALLPPGSYFVRVQHCCKGTGPYSLRATFEAN
ncbi:MAG: PPC domain-containing protein [Alphaproteobacteria bacterium]|nr:PPC domain-containing protein [Alphaproteobacteria bacterium]